MGSVKSWIEDAIGVVGLRGEISPIHGPELESAVDVHIENSELQHLIFDFKYATYFDSSLLNILTNSHKRTMMAGRKLMSLRNLDCVDIQRLLYATGLDKRFAIEGIDDLDGNDAWKLRFSSFRPYI